MNQNMIDKWNSVVRKCDTTIHLGDFAFGNMDDISELVDRLNGRKILILGNHDRKISKNVKKWIDVGFDEVYKYPILYKKFFFLSHEPIEHLTPQMPYANIHGHIHNNKYESKQYVNACVEQIDYTPVNIDVIINKLREESDKR